MSLKNVIIAVIGLVGALYVGFSLLNALLVFNGLLLAGMLSEVLFSKKIYYSEPIWEATITQKGETTFLQDNQKNLFVFFHIKQILERADLLKLIEVKGHNFHIIEKSGLVYLSLMLKAPKIRKTTEEAQSFKLKTEEFVETVKYLIPDIILTSVTNNSLISEILGFINFFRDINLNKDNNEVIIGEKTSRSDINPLVEALPIKQDLLVGGKDEKEKLEQRNRKRIPQPFLYSLAYFLNLEKLESTRN